MPRKVRTMQFTLNHQRQTIGQQIRVTVEAGPGQSITEVTTVFDGFSIGDDSLAPGTTQYDRSFDGESASSGASHILVVTAFDQNNSPESATKIWTDQI
jgi:hypothetical protein